MGAPARTSESCHEGDEPRAQRSERTVAAPARMPAAHVQRLATLISEIVRGPEMRQRLFQQGWQVVGSAPEGLKNRVETDTRALGDIIRQQKITLQ